MKVFWWNQKWCLELFFEGSLRHIYSFSKELFKEMVL